VMIASDPLCEAPAPLTGASPVCITSL
jgi:hypothetical protein